MAYRDFKDLNRRTFTYRVLGDKPLKIGKALPSMVYKIFVKKTSGSGIKNENILNNELAEVFHKLIIRKFKKRKVHSPFNTIFRVQM